MEEPLTDPWLEQFEARIREREQQHDTVTLLGVDLKLKPSVAPQVAVRYLSAKRRLTQFYLEREAAAKAKKKEPEHPADLYDEPLLDLFEQTARACITAESLPAWQDLRSPDRDTPLDWRDVMELCEYLISRAAYHPTDGPSGSSDGPSSNGVSSKAGSSSRAAKART
jgi:hypothetical protein